MTSGSNHTWGEGDKARYWYCDQLGGVSFLISEEDIARRALEDRHPCGCERYSHIERPEPIVVLPARKDP